MKALSYLIITQLKNKLLALKEKPLKLIFYIICTLFILGFIALMLFVEPTELMDGKGDINVVYLIIAGLSLLLFVTFILNGLSKGSTFFTMADVGLIFTAPISSKNVLTYGLISTSGKMMLSSVFILFQFSILRSSFGFGLLDLLTLLLIYVIVMVVGQLVAITVYVVSNGNVVRKNIVRGILIGLAAILAINIYLNILEGMELFTAILHLVKSEWFGYVPMAGWSVMIMRSSIEQSLLLFIIGFGLFVIFSGLLIFLLTRGQADYYEDVLVSTEVSAVLTKAAKEGTQQLEATKMKKAIVRKNDSTILKGSGSITIFYKHWLEIRRTQRIPIIDGFSIACAVAIYLFMDNFEADFGIYLVFLFMIYLLYFTTIMGKLKQELAKHYIYLIPQSSFHKVIAATLSSVLKPAIDGAIFCVVFILVKASDPITCIMVSIAYICTGVLFQAFNIVYQRLLGNQPSMILKGFLGFGLMMTLLTPGIVASVILYFTLPAGLLFLTSLPYIIISVLFTIIVILSCGNFLDQYEFKGR